MPATLRFSGNASALILRPEQPFLKHENSNFRTDPEYLEELHGQLGKAFCVYFDYLQQIEFSPYLDGDVRASLMTEIDSCKSD
jgi:hypothetical protein